MEIIKVGFSSCNETIESLKVPEKILEEIKKIETNEKFEAINYNSININDIPINNKNLNESDYNIYENSKESFLKNDKVIFIGGDHGLSYPVLRAFNKIEKNPFLIVFDAHIDSATGKPCDSWIRKLVESGFSPSSIIIVSARRINYDGIKFLKKFNIQVIKMDIINEDIMEICDLLMERARGSSGFYMSIDMDSIDPGFCPGLYNPEPGGLYSKDIIYFIKRLILLKNFRGADIVNINPAKDINDISIKLAAKLVSLMI